MAKKRLQLHDILCKILGSRNCYFRPPSGFEMHYPCIVYDHFSTEVDRADNIPYKTAKRYDITVIDENPDSEIPDRVLELPYCKSDRNFASEGLNHFTFTLYF